MYLGAWGPSCFQIMLFAGYTFVLGLVKPDHLPAVPVDELTLRGWLLWKKCLMGIVPSAVLIFVVLGTMMMGLATRRRPAPWRDRRHRARGDSQQGFQHDGRRS